MVYNASAEKKIYDLIEKSSQGSLLEGSETLKQALKALNQEFGASHYGDLPEHDVKRIQVRKKFYETIISAYDKLINKFIETNYETLSAESEKLKIDCERLSEEKKSLELSLKDTEIKREGLEETVDKLNYQVEQLTKSQQAIKDI